MKSIKRTLQQGLALSLILTFVTPGAVWSQETHVVDAAAMHRAIAEHTAADQARLETIRRVLRAAEVRSALAPLGMDLKTAEVAVATLTPSELERLAVQAEQVESALAGGTDRWAVAGGIVGLAVVLFLAATKRE
jgi:hypothetical protein